MDGPPAPAGGHDPQCEGWHLPDISCAKVAELRAHAAANPWICAHGPNGYHLYDSSDDDAVCQHGPCTRLLGELVGEAASAPQHTTY